MSRICYYVSKTFIYLLSAYLYIRFQYIYMTGATNQNNLLIARQIIRTDNPSFRILTKHIH